MFNTEKRAALHSKSTNTGSIRPRSALCCATASPKAFPTWPWRATAKEDEIPNIFLCTAILKTLRLCQSHGVVWWEPSFHIPKLSDPSSPCPATNCSCSSSSTAFPKLCFAFREMGTDVLWEGSGGNCPLNGPKCSSDGDFCTAGNLWNPFYSHH